MNAMVEYVTNLSNYTEHALNRSNITTNAPTFLNANDIRRKIQSEQTGFWSTWGGVLIVSVTVLVSTTLNLILSRIILRTPKFRNITYFYIVSMNMATTIHAMVNFPSNVIFDFLPPSPAFDHICILWIFGETVFGHSMQLHILGSSLDTYLRLAMPKWYGISGARPATTRLKLAAPWIVSLLQTTAQVLLGDPRPPSQLENGRMCTCPDVNFLLLRTTVAFTLPLLVTVIILFMAAYKLQKSTAKATFLFRTEEQMMGRPNYCHPRSNNANATCIQNAQALQLDVSVKSDLKIKSTFGELNKSDDINSNYGTVSPDLCLQNITALQTQGSTSSDVGISSQTTDEAELFPKLRPSKLGQMQENHLTVIPSTDEAIYYHSKDVESVNLITERPMQVLDHFCPQHGHFTVTLQPDSSTKIDGAIMDETPVHILDQEQSIVAFPVSQVNSCTLIVNNHCSIYPDVCAVSVPHSEQMENQADPPGSPLQLLTPKAVLTGFVQSHSETLSISDFPEPQSSLCGTFKTEQTAIKLNMIACATSIALWAPYMTASLVYLLLTTTQFSHLLSTSTLIQFKWLTYLSSVAYTIGHLVVDRQLLSAVLRYSHAARSSNCKFTKCTSGIQAIFCCRRTQ